MFRATATRTPAVVLLKSSGKCTFFGRTPHTLVCPRKALSTSTGFPSNPAPRAKRSGGTNHLFLKTIAGIGLVSGGFYLTNQRFHDGVDFFASTAQRVSVVSVATVKCFGIYKQALLKQYDTEQLRNQSLAAAHQKAAETTLRALEANGGIYIKLGQHISALTYLLPKEWTQTMTPLQDQCPQSSLEEIRSMFAQDMGVPLDEYFSHFDAVPVGVASLAQVHVATVRSTGEKVAVKFQHPSLSKYVPLDIFMTQTVFGLMHKVFPEYPLTWLGDEMQNSIYVELDFKNEAVNAENTEQQFLQLKSVTALRIPHIVRAEKRILIMEYVSGARLDNLEYMRQHKIHTGEVSACLSHIFNNMIFTPNVGLHCDPHQGNLAIRATTGRRNGHNFEIVLYDHGLYRYIPLQMKRDYSHFWLAILDGNVPEMKKYTEKLTGITDEQKFRIFASAITGRDTSTALNYDISKARDPAEMSNMQKQLHSEAGVLEDLMSILSSMPRIVLLILKTNDLTRNLDETLQSPLGPERTFLILARYCANAVYSEAKAETARRYTRFSVGWIKHSVSNWARHLRRLTSIYLYDVVISMRNFERTVRHMLISAVSPVRLGTPQI